MKQRFDVNFSEVLAIHSSAERLPTESAFWCDLLFILLFSWLVELLFLVQINQKL